jgi:5-methylcytosine-specific restriction endonuclease McrA
VWQRFCNSKCRINQWVEDTSPLVQQYRLYQRNALQRNIDFRLTISQFIKIIVSAPHCHYCKQEKQLGVDRVENSKGYTIENCVACCGPCNRKKNDGDAATLEKKLRRKP